MSLADLDDLINRCRTPAAKRSFSEAVACFRAGAYRGCIVLTWTAFLFDYVGKLRELELSGNTTAKPELEAFEKASARHDVQTLLRLEEEALEKAFTLFSLLSPLERADLERVKEDRNRCAHPSLLSLDEPYQPTAEQARVHMRNVVDHVLSRPPVQGKEASDRIWADINSQYFPDTKDGAIQRLQVSLAEARSSLVHGLIVALWSSFLDGPPTDQQRAALAAIIDLKHTIAEAFFAAKLATKAARVLDAHLQRVLDLGSSVPLAWDSFDAATRDRVNRFVQQSTSSYVLALACQIRDLRQTVEGLIPALIPDTLAKLAIRSKLPAALNEIVSRYEARSRYTTFRDLRPALEDETLVAIWTEDHELRLLRALVNNADLREYTGFDHIAYALQKIMGARATQHIVEWQNIHDRFVARDWVLGATKLRELVPGLTPPPAPPVQAALPDV